MSDINFRSLTTSLGSGNSTTVQYLIFLMALTIFVVRTHGAEASLSAIDQGARDRCSANLRAFGQYDRLISEAAYLHINSGVLSPEDFSGVLMGWCDLYDKRPGLEFLGQAHCRPPMSVFFDHRLRSRQFFIGRDYIINTLAHEMEHIRQYRSEGCVPTDSLRNEELADIAGDEADNVLFHGRYIFVENSCHKSVRLILEFKPHFTQPYKVDGWWALSPGQIAGLTDQEGNGVTTPDKNIYLYAESDDGQTIWSGLQSDVIFEGKDYSLMQANVSILGDRKRMEGSFYIDIICP